MKSILKHSYLIIVCALSIACYNPDDYIDIDKNKIIYLEKKDTTSIADGINKVTVKVKISDEAAREKREVIFKTDLGSFQNGSDSIVVDAEDNFMASASLASLVAGTATVSAEIMGVKAQNTYTIKFDKAYPEKITVSVDSFAIANNFQSEVLITASLETNNRGKSSAGHPVSFIVTNGNGEAVGTFLNNINTGTSDMKGKVFIRYSAGEVNQSGYLAITATTTTVTGSSISGTTHIFLSDK